MKTKENWDLSVSVIPLNSAQVKHSHFASGYWDLLQASTVSTHRYTAFICIAKTKPLAVALVMQVSGEKTCEEELLQNGNLSTGL